MNKLIFQNYFENIDPKIIQDELYNDKKVMYSYGLCVGATKIKYSNDKRRYRMKVEAIKNQFVDTYLEKLFYKMQIDKGKLNEDLLNYHKNENYKKYNFKKHFPLHYYNMFYYFSRKGAGRFPNKISRDFFLKTGKEPYTFSLSDKNKILVNDILCC